MDATKLVQRLFILLVTLFLLLAGHRLIGQGSGRDYAVLLSDSSVIRGKLLYYQPGEAASVRLNSGRILNFSSEQVLRVMPYRDYKASQRPDRPAAYRFPESGWFVDLSVATYHGGTLEEPTLGGSVQGVVGMRWNRWLETGLGTAYERYLLEQPYRVVPVYARLRGYLLAERFSPFYQLEAGYGWGLRKESDGIIDSGGGALIHPSFGIRLGGGAGINGYLDVGYRFQWASFSEEEFWEATTRRDYLFRRFTFRAGLIF